jgi:hypothetical protein
MFAVSRSALRTVGYRPTLLARQALFSLQQAADKHTLILVRHGESTWNLENKVSASVFSSN